MLKEILEGKYDSYVYDADPTKDNPLGSTSGICIVKEKDLKKVENALKAIEVYDDTNTGDYVATTVTTNPIGGRYAYYSVSFETFWYGMKDSKGIQKEIKSVMKNATVLEINEDVQ